MENFANYYKIVSRKLSAYLQGEKKLYVFLTAIFFVVIIIGFFSPSLLQNKREKWNHELQDKLSEIRKTSQSTFDERQSKLINTANEIITFSVKNKDLTISTFESSLNDENFEQYQIFLLDSTNNEVFSNAQAGIVGQDVWNENVELKTTFFYSTPLLTSLCYGDRIHIQGRKYNLIIASIFESTYITKGVTPENNFSSGLENIFNSEVEVFYTPAKAKSLDGRYYSFEIPNNHGQKIGLITVAKPTLKAELKTFKEETGKTQSLFIVAGIILLGIILRNETKQLKKKWIKPILEMLFLVFLRWILFALKFPIDYFPEELTNPNYFSSAFAGGIVKSPMEFLLTAFFFCLIVFYIKNYFKNRIADFFETKLKNLVLRFGLALISIFILLLSIRGIAAAVKSVVFDSSLRYFDTADLIPGIPHLVMHIAIFLVTLSALVLIQVVLKIIYLALPGTFSAKKKTIIVFLVIPLCAVIFVLVQKQPLISIMLFLFAIILALIVFFITEIRETKVLKYLLVISFASSLLTISLMNFFNTELEKEEIKRTAIFLSRSQESYLNFLLNESLTKIVRQPKLTDLYLSSSTNYSSLSLALWLQSSLRDEKVISSITLLDNRKKILGYFSCGVSGEQLVPQIAQAAITKDLQIFDISDKTKQWQKILCGIIPITVRNQIAGYAASTVIFTVKNALSVNSTAALFQQPELNLRTLSEKNFNVFLLAEDKIYAISGNVLPSADDASRLYSYLSKEKEGWINYEGASENLLGFGIQRINAGSHPYLIVAQKETAFSFSLFNFFKLFIVHSTFLLAVLLIFFLTRIKGKFRLTFRSQLLFAFLLIAVLPIIALAVYNKNSVEQKNITLIHNSLKEKAGLAENYFITQIPNNGRKQLQKVFEDANKNLLLSFSVFDNSQLIYSSQQNLYDAALLSKNMSSLLAAKKDQPGNGYFVKHFIGSREVISYFKTISLNNQELLLEVNDYFNQIPVALNFVEVNVFLFGVYSLAIVLIIIVSSLLADQISLPIRKLTRATSAVAHGDLNVMLNDNSMGEMKELLSGFNIMTEELRKNQQELAELEREQAWKEMARQVAHEIKNPLTPMKLTLQQLVAMYKTKSKNFDSLFEKVSETILAQIETLSQIASEFSSFAKMPSLNLTEIDLKKSLSEIILLFNDENISISLNYHANATTLMGDESQLKRMFINLIRNSIQATADAVSFTIDEDEKYLFIKVSDNGKGIPDKFLHKIFTINFTTKTTGMGLGLKLAKKFVESVNGDISVKESSSAGTTFLIRFLKEIGHQDVAV